MSDVQALRDFAHVDAAGRLLTDVTSNVDVRPLGEDDYIVTAVYDVRPLISAPLGWRCFGSQDVPAIISEDVAYGEPGLVMQYVDAPVSRHWGVFNTLDDLKTPKGQVRRLVENLHCSRFLSSLSYLPRLLSRLSFLCNIVEEEDGWTGHSVGSLRYMLLFLESTPTLKYPTVTVTPAGTFRAQWTAGRSAHFALDFLADGQVQFVVFSADPRRPERIQRVSGVVGWDNVMEIVAPYRVQRWAAGAGTTYP